MVAQHRVWQFLSALGASVTPQERDSLARYLSPPQLALFLQMPANDQSHAFRTLRYLLDRGHDNTHLLQAALLHDAGKSSLRSGLVTRVAAVLLRALGQGAIHQLARVDGPLWRRRLYVLANHASIGAKLAASAGSAPEVVQLIESHSVVPNGELAVALYEADEAS